MMTMLTQRSLRKISLETTILSLSPSLFTLPFSRSLQVTDGTWMRSIGDALRANWPINFYFFSLFQLSIGASFLLHSPRDLRHTPPTFHVSLVTDFHFPPSPLSLEHLCTTVWDIDWIDTKSVRSSQREQREPVDWGGTCVFVAVSPANSWYLENNLSHCVRDRYSSSSTDAHLDSHHGQLPFHMQRNWWHRDDTRSTQLNAPLNQHREDAFRRTISHQRRLITVPASLISRMREYVSSRNEDNIRLCTLKNETGKNDWWCDEKRKTIRLVFTIVWYCWVHLFTLYNGDILHRWITHWLHVLLMNSMEWWISLNWSPYSTSAAHEDRNLLNVIAQWTRMMDSLALYLINSSLLLKTSIDDDLVMKQSTAHRWR